MANPNLASSGDPEKIDLVADSAANVGLKRGYSLGDTISGATSNSMHQGVAAAPAAVIAVDQKAAAAASAALPAVANKRNYLCGFSISGSGADAAARVRATITGIGVTWGIDILVPVGDTVGITPIVVQFANPIPASAVNTAITLAVPSFGTGNDDVSICVWGYVGT